MSDDLTGYLTTWEVSPGETEEVNIAWAADDDGQPNKGEFTKDSPNSVIGIKLLESSNPNPKISYNWWISNSEGYPKDWGPWLKANQLRWKEINPYGSGKFFPDSAMGTPGGDRSKYFLLSNGEIDFDQVFADTLPKLDASWTPVPSQYSEDIVQGFDIRFIYSFGPFDIAPGDTIFAAIALAAGENLHVDPSNWADNLPDNPYLYYRNLDFCDLVYNAQKAQEVYESGYTLPPPGPPDDFIAFAMDGNTVKLSWSPKNRPNLKGYNIYRSLNPDDPSPEKINPELITNTVYLDEGLTEGEHYAYWISCVNEYDLEGMRKPAEVLAGRPRTPTKLVAETSKDQVLLSWSGSREKDLAGYRIYRKDYGSLKLIDSAGVGTEFVDRSVTNGVIYHYRITAVDSLGLESFLSDSVYALPMAFDRGIGIFDRTLVCPTIRYRHPAGFGLKVDSLYQRIFEQIADQWDYFVHDEPKKNWDISLEDLSPYPVVMIHSENLIWNWDPSTDSTALILRHYLLAGGKLIFEGINNTTFFFSHIEWGEEPDFCDSVYLARRDSLLCEYLFLDEAYVPYWDWSKRTEEFVGAYSNVSHYPNLEVDPERIDSGVYVVLGPPFEDFGLLEGKLPGVGYIVPKDTSVFPAEVIYTFHSAYDTSDLEGKPVAIRYLGDDYKFVFFNFPLYFIKEEQAIQVLHQALSDLGVPTSVDEEFDQEILAGNFSLEQNYPNPFNSSTTIPFTVHGERKTENRPVRTTLTIYNILGRRVRTLLNEEKVPGQYRVTWDGKDERGNEVGSGVYLYRLKAGDFEQTKKMVLLK